MNIKIQTMTTRKTTKDLVATNHDMLLLACYIILISYIQQYHFGGGHLMH